MNDKIVYHCPGSCKGVSATPTNCGAEDCELNNQPLEAWTQCEGCVDAAAKDKELHFCDKCTKN